MGVDAKTRLRDGEGKVMPLADAEPIEELFE
jgi:hypothetical protein